MVSAVRLLPLLKAPETVVDRVPGQLVGISAAAALGEDDNAKTPPRLPPAQITAVIRLPARYARPQSNVHDGDQPVAGPTDCADRVAQP